MQMEGVCHFDCFLEGKEFMVIKVLKPLSFLMCVLSFPISLHHLLNITHDSSFG